MLRVCLLLLLAAALAACGARQVKTERKGRIITLTDTILDTGGTDTVRFGRLHSGEIAQLRLWLANETSGPVVIAKYGRSCGCTTLEFPKNSWRYMPPLWERTVLSLLKTSRPMPKGSETCSHQSSFH